jgi:hypothetical protein
MMDGIMSYKLKFLLGIFMAGPEQQPLLATDPEASSLSSDVSAILSRLTTAEEREKYVKGTKALALSLSSFPDNERTRALSAALPTMLAAVREIETPPSSPPATSRRIENNVVDALQVALRF